MKLLLYPVEGHVILRTNIVSFVVYDPRSLPAALGIEYQMPAGIARTFVTTADEDFHSVLQRSGLGRENPVPLVPGQFSLYASPYLGQGIPDWTAGICRLLAVNDYGKHLFAFHGTDAGIFAASAYGCNNFNNFVNSTFSLQVQ